MPNHLRPPAGDGKHRPLQIVRNVCVRGRVWWLYARQRDVETPSPTTVCRFAAEFAMRNMARSVGGGVGYPALPVVSCLQRMTKYSVGTVYLRPKSRTFGQLASKRACGLVTVRNITVYAIIGFAAKPVRRPEGWPPYRVAKDRCPIIFMPVNGPMASVGPYKWFAMFAAGAVCSVDFMPVNGTPRTPSPTMVCRFAANLPCVMWQPPNNTFYRFPQPPNHPNPISPERRKCAAVHHNYSLLFILSFHS